MVFSQISHNIKLLFFRPCKDCNNSVEFQNNLFLSQAYRKIVKNSDLKARSGLMQNSTNISVNENPKTFIGKKFKLKITAIWLNNSRINSFPLPILFLN